MSSESEVSLVVNGLDITSLDDDDLFSQLQSLGTTVGPIVSSTRRIYQRKLAILMGGSVPASEFNGDVDEEENFSDSPSAPESPPIARQEVRQRIYEPEVSSYEPVSSRDYSPSIHTPSPRRSLRTVHSTTTTTITTKRGQSKRSEDTVDAPCTTSTPLRILVKMLLFIVLFIALFYAYKTYYSESPYIGLEELAKQALDAVQKKQKIGAADESKDPPVH